jgi:hypothetical protein
VLENHVQGRAKKDFEDHVVRCARLGIFRVPCLRPTARSLRRLVSTASAMLLDTEELFASVSAMLDAAVRRTEEEAQRAEQEAQAC